MSASPTPSVLGGTYKTYNWLNTVTDATSLDTLYSALTNGGINFDTDTIPITLKANSVIALGESDVVKYAKMLTKVTSAFKINLVGDVTLANLKSVPDTLISKINLPTGKTNVAASGNVADFMASIGKLQVLGTKISTVSLSDKADSTIALTAAALTANSVTLKKIIGAYALNVTDVAAANATTTASTVLTDTKKTSTGTVVSLSVLDTSANISGKLDALQALSISKTGMLSSVTSSDKLLIKSDEIATDQ